jgi:uncharacterized protein YndB with AHSA1/START domain
VLAYDRPHAVRLAWRPYSEPGSRQATEVEIRFSPKGESTRVELEHRGWERLGETAADSRQNSDGGWDHVLRRYTEAFA